LEQDVVAWNIELESNFCYIDPQRLLILGYNATYGDNSAYKNDTIRIRNRRFPSRRYLSDHARRYRHVMKMLGEEQSVHRDLNSPEKFELEEKSFPTDYAFIRAGSRGKELTVSDKSDQYAKFFTVGAKQILMPDEDEDVLVGKQKYLTTEGKLLFKPSGGPAGQWMQRSFQFSYNYLTLFDANLKDYGIDPSDSNHKVHVNELYYSNFDKYKKKFVTKTPNDLTNWDRIDDILYDPEDFKEFEVNENET